MKKMIFILVMALCLMSGLTVQAADRDSVFVTIVPQKYFVEKIAGDLVDVHVLVMPGANPHMYEPSPAQMAALEKSRAYFAIGIALENAWLPRISGANPSLRIVYTQRGITKIPMVAHEHHDHGDHGAAHKGHDHKPHAAAHEGHGHEGCSHDSMDPHIWLDPIRVRTIAKNICKGLTKADPQHKATYEANLAAFMKEIDTTHEAITKILASRPADRRNFMVFHPSWGYFADRYDLTQLPIEAEGKEPSPKDMVKIIKHARENGISVIFVQPQFSERSAKIIAGELNAKVVPLDPLAEDWSDNLLKAARSFKAQL